MMGKGSKGTKQIAPSSINQLNTLVKKGQAPKNIRAFHTKGDPSTRHTLVEHIQFKDGSALGKDGVWCHGGRKLTNEEINFLKAHGWKIPE
ncbi:MAG: hypothetical protein ACX93T_03760 [Bacteroidota bacterium]